MTEIKGEFRRKLNFQYKKQKFSKTVTNSMRLTLPYRSLISNEKPIYFKKYFNSIRVLPNNSPKWLTQKRKNQLPDKRL